MLAATYHICHLYHINTLNFFSFYFSPYPGYRQCR